MHERSYQSFTELELWKRARFLKNEIKETVEAFPQYERYRLTDQIIRSSRGINAAIAEGHGRFTFKDQLHFCIIARGSLSETENHLIDALDCKYITVEKCEYLQNIVNDVRRLLNGYINYLRKNMFPKI
ncbi:MAG: four helix bundle protein [Chitinophagaceae bacterium]|nr:four helix bundle protein [Chitinophagaceae bacterium]